MMRYLICALRAVTSTGFLLLVFHQVSAQTNTVKGIIKDPNGKPVQYANVLLLKSSDSSLVKGMISDSSGKYFFKNISTGEYYVTISFAGMEQIFTKAFEIISDKNEIDQGVLYLKNTGAQLTEITVAGKKPMFEQKIDRMVINVKGGVTSTAGTALDLLEKSPGITVNRQTNSIAINGKNGVNVMINGKMSYMPMDALVQMLAGIPATNIDRIELITAPPSKYDAAGNAGYINIVLISNPYAGFSGSYFLTAGYGERELGAAGFAFNYRSAKINLYGSYTFNYDHTLQESTGFTQLMKSGDIITNNSFSHRDAIRHVQNARLGIDYQLNPSTIIGALVSGYVSHWSMVANNGTTVSKNHIVDTVITSTDDPEFNIWQNLMTNVNFQHSFKPGKLLFFDVNYIYYKDDNPNTYSTNYYNNAKVLLRHENSKNGKVTPIHFWVFSSDYKTPLSRKITMEAGAKFSSARFTNDTYTSSLKEGIWVPDPALSVSYLLKENIAAAYTSFTMNLDNNISITAGLRYEYTNSNLGTKQTANIVDRKYGELFPTFYISKKFDNNNNIGFSYSRRITRPAFNDLAPFTVFFDPKTFYAGNAALQPAIANSVQANYGFKNYSFSLSYTYENNTIENFYFQTQKIDTATNIVYLSPSNFRYEQFLNTTFSLPVIVTAWWSMQNNINGSWRQINATFDNKPTRLENFNFSINSTQRFTLSSDLSFELTGFYASPAYFGTAKREFLYRVDAGLQKKLSNKKDILRITATDIFNSGSDWRFGETLPATGAIVNRTFNFRTVAYKLTYTHNFGNNSLKGKRERSTGAEDELKRVNN